MWYRVGGRERVASDIERRARDVVRATLLVGAGYETLAGDREIAELVHGSSDLGVACERLVARANEEGGPDNISCAAFYVRGDALPPADSPPQTTALTPPLLFR